MVECQKSAVEKGYVETVWGRRRWFPLDGSNSAKAAAERESQNFPRWIGEVKPSEFGGSRLCLQLYTESYQCIVAEVIPSEAVQECTERVTTSVWSPERAVKRHERPARVKR